MKYYVVWKGFAPGVYDSWEEAEMQVSGYPDASYRSFKTMEAAVEAFREGFDKEGLIHEVQKEMDKISREGTPINFDKNKKVAPSTTQQKASPPKDAPSVNANPAWIKDSIAVDAACSGNPGPMEYRGVYVKTGLELFRIGPMQGGTNNIGEFLAIVHGLAMQEKQGTRLPLYSDSVNAQIWVRKGICKTTIQENAENAPIFDMIRRAETWLRTHSFRVPIYKWDTPNWGEIPADFGRK